MARVVVVGPPEEELVDLQGAPRDAAFAARDHLLRHRTLGRHLADEAPDRRRTGTRSEVSTTPKAAGAGHSRQARRQMLRSAARRDAERLAQRMVEDDAVELTPTVIVRAVRLLRQALERKRDRGSRRASQAARAK